MRVRYDSWHALQPMSPDVFTMVGTGARIAFTRDKRGAVNGYTVSAARTLNVIFERAP